MTQNNPKTKLEKLICDAVESVYSELGGVFQEAIYQAALCVEFNDRKINFQSQPVVAVHYKNRSIGSIRPDFLIQNEDEKIILEIKVRESKFDCPQVRKYIETCRDVTGAMLVYFGISNLNIKTNFLIHAPENSGIEFLF